MNLKKLSITLIVLFLFASLPSLAQDPLEAQEYKSLTKLALNQQFNELEEELKNELTKQNPHILTSVWNCIVRVDQDRE